MPLSAKPDYFSGNFWFYLPDGETGPYVQYSYARAASVLRKAGEMGLDTLDEPSDYSAVTSVSAYSLIKLIGGLSEVISEAGEKHEPSLLTRHVTDIAQAFSVFYHEEPILNDTGDARLSKLALTAAAKQAIKNGLCLLGISVPERM
jgi:arginyl-tRNA synthetase